MRSKIIKSKMARQRFENLGNGIQVAIDKEFSFGLDSFLLARFVSPQPFESGYDLGAGSGILSFLLLRWQEKLGRFYAVDLQQRAMCLLKKAVLLSHAQGRVVPVCCDFRGLSPLEKANLIVSNPPYYDISSGKQNNNRAVNIARHTVYGGLYDLLETAGRLLCSGGRLCFCYKPERLAEIFFLMRQVRLEPKRLQMVAKDVSSAPWLCLIEGRKEAKTGLEICPQFLVYDTEGNLTEMTKNVYPLNWEGSRS